MVSQLDWSNNFEQEGIHELKSKDFPLHGGVSNLGNWAGKGADGQLEQEELGLRCESFSGQSSGCLVRSYLR